MKYFAVLILCLGLFFNVDSQNFKSQDVGLISGITYYQGDANLNRHFPSIGYIAGANLRYNFNKRLSVNNLLTFGNFKDLYSDYGTNTQLNSQNNKDGKFINSFRSISSTIEFNFKKFDQVFHAKGEKFAPFVSTGVGLFISQNLEGGAYSFSVPLSMGVKFTISDRMYASLIYTVNKIFNDGLDKIHENEDPFSFDNSKFINRYKQTTYKNNKDWLFYTAINVYYIISYSKDCSCPNNYNQ